MKKWWRKYKNKHGWDFTKESVGLFFYRPDGEVYTSCDGNIKSLHLVSDPNGCYTYTCKYCDLQLKFPWKETNLAYHNMQKHIRAKHIDVL